MSNIIFNKINKKDFIKENIKNLREPFIAIH